ncbi:MAG: hypothetical protein Q4C77_10390 [Eubacteriales bacterium]|nr:hypothetical protein [Eubacteriales bacterium]
MKRDMINSLMAGGLLSFLPIWEADPAEQIVIAMGLAALVYMINLFFAKEKEHV